MLQIKRIIQNTVKESVESAVSTFFSKEFELIKNELKRLNELKESVEYLSFEYDRVKADLAVPEEKIKSLAKDNSTLNQTVESLSARLNLIEQHSRENNLEISGIPENRSENLYSVINQLGNTVSLPIPETDILSCTRVRKMDETYKRPRSVIVKLRNTKVRDSIIAAVSKFNKKRQTERLNSGDLGYGGNKSNIYVSGHLSPFYKALHARTRNVAKEKGIRYVWIRNGRIFFRKNDQSPAKQIKCYNSLNNF